MCLDSWIRLYLEFASFVDCTCRWLHMPYDNRVVSGIGAFDTNDRMQLCPWVQMDALALRISPQWDQLRVRVHRTRRVGHVVTVLEWPSWVYEGLNVMCWRAWSFLSDPVCNLLPFGPFTKIWENVSSMAQMFMELIFWIILHITMSIYQLWLFLHIKHFYPTLTSLIVYQSIFRSCNFYITCDGQKLRVGTDIWR